MAVDDYSGRESFPTHGNVERIFRLLQFLLANECTRYDVFDHLASYYKTNSPASQQSSSSSRSADKLFERDLHFLKEQGFEIQKVRKRNQPVRYHIERGSGPGTTFLFTEQEVDSLALLYNMFADPARFSKDDPSLPPLPFPSASQEHPFTQDILTLIEKFVSTLPPEQRQHFERWVQKPYLYFHLSTVVDYLPHRVTIDSIIQAISHRQQIAFDYMPAQGQQDVVPHAQIDPYYIIYMEGHFYLIAYNHKVSSFLEYRIDRIEGKTLKEQPTMIDSQRRRHPLEFRFWLDASLSKQGLSQRWLTQTIEEEQTYQDPRGQERKRVLVHATAYSEWRVLQQILKYGEKAEIIDPPHLRARMKRVIQQMSSLYAE
ncbi:helix-turn-helix transcriptional regulator [Dictyobacter arantiisoli]|uniref:Uncharacterized protein n=1 Tax=Dictyobacter arantiisoli TaxID=2014874 RepID=A0A5A5TG55_9CHLR|nr:WYL domain-containing protein [Dictyobacter arantiisoli]GCF10205.1 hypothetical protein KDI_37690 [Dictyobacter arantiisoli]